jgi:hypothetical protein
VPELVVSPLSELALEKLEVKLVQMLYQKDLCKTLKICKEI